MDLEVRVFMNKEYNMKTNLEALIEYLDDNEISEELILDYYNDQDNNYFNCSTGNFVVHDFHSLRSELKIIAQEKFDKDLRCARNILRRENINYLLDSIDEEDVIREILDNMNVNDFLVNNSELEFLNKENDDSGHFIFSEN